MSFVYRASAFLSLAVALPSVAFAFGISPDGKYVLNAQEYLAMSYSCTDGSGNTYNRCFRMQFVYPDRTEIFPPVSEPAVVSAEDGMKHRWVFQPSPPCPDDPSTFPQPAGADAVYRCVGPIGGPYYVGEAIWCRGSAPAMVGRVRPTCRPVAFSSCVSRGTPDLFPQLFKRNVAAVTVPAGTEPARTAYTGQSCMDTTYNSKWEQQIETDPLQGGKPPP